MSYVPGTMNATNMAAYFSTKNAAYAAAPQLSFSTSAAAANFLPPAMSFSLPDCNTSIWSGPPPRLDNSSSVNSSSAFFHHSYLRFISNIY